MVEMYVSWAKGLPQDREALGILRESGVVAGVELSNIDDQYDMIKDAGLNVSSHTPGLNLTLNLADPNYMDVFDGENGPRLLQTIRDSDAPVVGFHLGYSAKSVYKMKAYPNVPRQGSLITDESELREMLVGNIRALDDRINENGSHSRKRVVLESLDYSRQKPIPWNVQYEDAWDNRSQIDVTVERYGINAGIMHVTDPAFIRKVLQDSGESVGFLFDVGHVLISADAKINDGTFTGEVEEYFDQMMTSVNGRTHQVHLTVPDWDRVEGYTDHHRTFYKGECVSEHVLDLASDVVSRSPNLEVLTLEMMTGLEPIEHAREMVRQAEYVARQLDI